MMHLLIFSNQWFRLGNHIPLLFLLHLFEPITSLKDFHRWCNLHLIMQYHSQLQLSHHRIRFTASEILCVCMDQFRISFYSKKLSSMYLGFTSKQSIRLLTYRLILQIHHVFVYSIIHAHYSWSLSLYHQFKGNHLQLKLKI